MLNIWEPGFIPTWKDKPVSCSQIEAVTTVCCAYMWMCTSKLKIETGALIVAAQDQTLHIRAYNNTIFQMPVSPTFRLCNCANETIFHLLSACPYLAGTQYVQRHNSVASLLYRLICTHYMVFTLVRSLGCMFLNLLLNQEMLKSSGILKLEQIISSQLADQISLLYVD